VLNFAWMEMEEGRVARQLAGRATVAERCKSCCIGGANGVCILHVRCGVQGGCRLSFYGRISNVAIQSVPKQQQPKSNKEK